MHLTLQLINNFLHFSSCGFGFGKAKKTPDAKYCSYCSPTHSASTCREIHSLTGLPCPVMVCHWTITVWGRGLSNSQLKSAITFCWNYYVILISLDACRWSWRTAEKRQQYVNNKSPLSLWGYFNKVLTRKMIMMCLSWCRAGEICHDGRWLMVWYHPLAKPWILSLNIWTHTHTHTHTHTLLKVRMPKITQYRYEQVNHILPQVYAHCSLTVRLPFAVVTVTFTNCQLLYRDCNFEMYDKDAIIILLLLLLLHGDM